MTRGVILGPHPDHRRGADGLVHEVKRLERLGQEHGDFEWGETTCHLGFFVEDEEEARISTKRYGVLTDEVPNCMRCIIHVDYMGRDVRD